MLWRLVQSTLMEPEKLFRWDHFIIHLAFALGYSLMYYNGFCVFLKNPEEVVMVFNQLFEERENPVDKMMNEEEQQQKEAEDLRIKSKGNCGTKVSAKKEEDPSKKVEEKEASESGSKTISETDTRVRPLLTWPPQYSLDELMARTFVLLVQGTKLFVLLMYAADLKRPQFWYSVLPPEYQNGYSFFGLLAVEAIFLTVAIAIASFLIVVQLLFFGKCQAEFQRLDLQIKNLKEKFQGRPFKNRESRREIWILRQISKEMKELVLFVEIFNRCFPPCIFAWKLICLLSILLYFFTIRHFHEFPFLAVFTGYVAVLLTLVYGILYEKAFSIPQKMERLKNEFLITANKTTSASTKARANGSFQAEMTREIGGIRDVGVKVGSFHMLERETTPRFIDFVFKNVVNLLVTFPR